MKKIINKKNFFYSSIWFLFFFSIIANASNVKIIAKIDNDIITNIDIQNEYSYLLALNKSLKDIQKEQVFDFAKQSIFREKIKKQEISKYYELNQISLNPLKHERLILPIYCLQNIWKEQN